MFKDYHIILVPKDKSNTRTFKVSGFTLKVLLVTVILSIPLFFVSVLSSIHYQNKLITLKRDNYENQALLVNKVELTQKLAQLEKNLSLIDDSVEHLGEIMDVDTQSIRTGLGPISDTEVSLSDSVDDIVSLPNPEDVVNVASWVEQNGEMTMGKFSQKINLFKEDAAALSQKLEEIFLLNKDKIRFSNASPSLMPVDGWVTSDFGMRVHPIGRSFKMHQGVDIASPRGTPVKAPAAGKVIFAGSHSGYGSMIALDHGYGVSTIFAHLSKIGVKKGQTIDRGEVIGNVGSTGATTGPHLHYEVQVDGLPSDPLAFIVK